MKTSIFYYFLVFVILSFSPFLFFVGVTFFAALSNQNWYAIFISFGSIFSFLGVLSMIDVGVSQRFIRSIIFLVLGLVFSIELARLSGLLISWWSVYYALISTFLIGVLLRESKA